MLRFTVPVFTCSQAFERLESRERHKRIEPGTLSSSDSRRLHPKSAEKSTCFPHLREVEARARGFVAMLGGVVRIDRRAQFRFGERQIAGHAGDAAARAQDPPPRLTRLSNASMPSSSPRMGDAQDRGGLGLRQVPRGNRFLKLDQQIGADQQMLCSSVENPSSRKTLPLDGVTFNLFAYTVNRRVAERRPVMRLYVSAIRPEDCHAAL